MGEQDHKVALTPEVLTALALASSPDTGPGWVRLARSGDW
jgi:hypothetical protein